VSSFLHGSRYGYRAKRCRCEYCRAWNAACMRRYRQRHPNRNQPNGWASYNERRNYATD